MARDDYWTRRALADEAAAERLARQAAKEMRRVYRGQYEAVLREIEGLMAEIAEGGTPTRTQLWNYARWRRLEERLREFAGEASRRCEQKITDCLDEVFRTVIGADIADMTGAVWQASISPKAVLEAAWSGEHYSARIWHNTAAIAQRVREDVTDMVVQGKGLSQVRRKLMEDFSAAYSDADRLVRTEAAYVRNQAALTRYRQNGRRKVRWTTGKSDGRECAVCRERDGQEYDIDAAPRLPAHPNCRCCYAPVVEAGLTQQSPAEPSENDLQTVNEYGTIKPYEEMMAERSIKKNSELKNGLPIRGKANSITDMTDDEGTVLQRRVYGRDGKAVVDFDTTDHIRRDTHPTGAHKHSFDYRRKNPHGKPLPLNDIDLKNNADIIQRGVNYFDPE